MSSETTPLRTGDVDQSYGSTPTAVSVSSQEEEEIVKDGVEDGSLPRVQLTPKEFWLMLLGLFMTVCESRFFPRAFDSCSWNLRDS